MGNQSAICCSPEMFIQNLIKLSEIQIIINEVKYCVPNVFIIESNWHVLFYLLEDFFLNKENKRKTKKS